MVRGSTAPKGAELLSENRLGFGIRTVGTWGLPHSLDPHRPMSSAILKAMAAATAWATHPLTNPE